MASGMDRETVDMFPDLPRDEPPPQFRELPLEVHRICAGLQKIAEDRSRPIRERELVYRAMKKLVEAFTPDRGGADG